jgi:hypothetical protein
MSYVPALATVLDASSVAPPVGSSTPDSDALPLKTDDSAPEITPEKLVVPLRNMDCAAPLLVADRETLKTIYHRAMERRVRLSLYIEDMFSTGHDAANRATVKQYAPNAVSFPLWRDLCETVMFGANRDSLRRLAGGGS